MNTLIVVPAVNDVFADNLHTFQGGDTVVMDTSAGGYPSAAFIRAYREHEADSYLFIQDSLVGNGDVVAPFRELRAAVVGWASFPLFFDNEEQQNWVAQQYRWPWPERGIFGPIFFATRKAMRKLDSQGLFPKTPRNRLEYQGTERAWAIAFFKAGYGVKFLGPCVTDGVSPRLFPGHPVFTKTFAGRA